MGKTYKDSPGKRRRIIIAKQEDGSFNILERGEIVHSNESEETLKDLLCRKWGYCGQELIDILRELGAVGQKTL